MVNFVNDYSEGAHEKIIERLSAINRDKNIGYGEDEICKSAADKIRLACECPEAEVYFLTGGTQTNVMAIDTLAEPYEGVVSASSGHVFSHEAGAVEYSGHKVLTIPERNGKLCPEDLKKYLEIFYNDGNYEHMVFPGIVYISHPSEMGTLYTLEELTKLHEICNEYDIPLYLDGARLGYGLMSETDVTLPDIARLTDAFYIGGTKVGAFYGEALVFTKNNMPKHFNTQVKRHGAMLAKGWLVGTQFDVLFTDGLYFEISKNAIEMAQLIKDDLKSKGYRFLVESPTNQIFVIIENARLAELGEKMVYSFFDRFDDDHTVIRIATSWATTKEQVDGLLEIM